MRWLVFLVLATVGCVIEPYVSCETDTYGQTICGTGVTGYLQEQIYVNRDGVTWGQVTTTTTSTTTTTTEKRHEREKKRLDRRRSRRDPGPVRRLEGPAEHRRRREQLLRV